MIYIQLIIEFFKIGLFAIGGGLATLPFLYTLAGKYQWYSQADIVNMLAISESTPGPIGINMSTFVGFVIAGLPGSLLSTIALSIPGITFSLIVFSFIKKFQSSSLVKSSFYGIRPAVTALITTALIETLKSCVINIDAYNLTSNILELLNLKAAAAFVLFIFLIRKFKFHPVIYILCGVIMGIFFPF